MEISARLDLSLQHLNFIYTQQQQCTLHRVISARKTLFCSLKRRDEWNSCIRVQCDVLTCPTSSICYSRVIPLCTITYCPCYVADDLRVSRSWLWQCLHKTLFLLFFELAATCCSLFHILWSWVARITSSKRRLIIQLCCLIRLCWRPIQYCYCLLCCHRGITMLTPPPTTTSYAYVTFAKTVRHNRGTTAPYVTGFTDTCPLCINVWFYSW